MIPRKNIENVLSELSAMSASFLPWLENFGEEKCEWLNQVLEDSKENGFRMPNLPKTPAAAKRTRKRHLSIIVENDVDVTSTPTQAQQRVTRHAVKMAKHKVLTLEATPDLKPAKKRKASKDTSSAKCMDESVVLCSPATVKLIVKKEVIALDETVTNEYQNTIPSEKSDQSLSTDSGFDPKMVLEEEPCSAQNLNLTFVKAADSAINNAELGSSDCEGRGLSVKKSLVTGVQVSESQYFTPCKQRLKDFDERAQHESSVDLITPYKIKMNSTFNVSVNKHIIEGESVKSMLNCDMASNLKTGTVPIQEQTASPKDTLNSTYVLPIRDLTERKENLDISILETKFIEPRKTQTSDETKLGNVPDNCAIEENKKNQPVNCQTDVDLTRNIVEFNNTNKGVKSSTFQELANDSKAKITHGSGSCTPVNSIPIESTASTSTTKDLSVIVSGDLGKTSDQKTSSAHLTVTRQGSTTPKGKGIPVYSESVKKRIAAYEKLQSVQEVPVPDELGETRMTRTKTRAAAAAAAIAAAGSPCKQKPLKQKKQKKHNAEELKKLAEKSMPSTGVVDNIKERCVEPGKENSLSVSSTRSVIMHSVQKPGLRTPYTTPRVLGEIHNLSSLSAKSNSTISLKPGIINTSVATFINKVPSKPTLEEREEKKLDEQRKRKEKELEAALKKEELLREKIEAQKRKREERMKKVLEARQAHEKEKEEQQRHLLEEKNRRMECIIREQEAKQKEQVCKKKLHTQQKNAEVEERRKFEEAARLAKLKEQEEEQLRLQALRKKEQDEAEKLRLRRLAEEKEAILLREKIEQQGKAEAKAKDKNQEKELVDCKVKLVKLHPMVKMDTFKEPGPGPLGKNVNDYGIIDANSGDSSDDDERPKKPVPIWAQKPNRTQPLTRQIYVRDSLLMSFMSCTNKKLDLTKVFPRLLKLKRTSSAVWATPPLHR